MMHSWLLIVIILFDIWYYCDPFQFSRFRVNKFHPAKPLHASSFVHSLAQFTNNLIVPDDERTTFMNLVSFGSKWLDESDLKNVHIDSLRVDQRFADVPGCLSKIRLKSIVDNFGKIRIVGSADSKIALGLLALLSEAVNGISKDELLQITPSEFNSILSNITGMNNFLSSQRLSGFQSIFKTIQSSLADSLPIQPGPDSRSDEVAMLLSGGVDSSVALSLLVSQGYKVRAYYLKIWLEDELAHLSQCPFEDDLKYAKQICETLHVPLEVVSLQSEYWNTIINYTLSEAKLGRTPNPDILCNSKIKFGIFFDYFGRFHSKIATGHYAKIVMDPSPTLLKELEQMGYPGFLDGDNRPVYLERAADPVKDQSYFLSHLNQSQLEKCIFPLADMTKQDVRQLAFKENLSTYSRKDSQGLCFLGKIRFEEFIHHYLGENPGLILFYDPFRGDKTAGTPVVDNVARKFTSLLNREKDSEADHNGESKPYSNGPKYFRKVFHHKEVIGKHKGLWYYTIGQRKLIPTGLFPQFSHYGPFYVAKKDMNRNVLYVTNEWDFIENPRKICFIENVHWLLGAPPNFSHPNLQFSLLSPDIRKELELQSSPFVSSVSNHEMEYFQSKEFLIHTKLRHSPKTSPAKLVWIHKRPKGEANHPLCNENVLGRIELFEKDTGIATGQFAAVYLDNKYCIASGMISVLSED